MAEEIESTPSPENRELGPYGLLFDHVSLEKMGGYNLLNVMEWLAIPTDKRVKLLLDNKVRFLNKDDVVPVMEALTSLKDALADGRIPSS